MNLNLNWNEWLQVYVSDDGSVVYDPSTGQVYQFNGLTYAFIGTAQLDSAPGAWPMAPSPSIPFSTFPTPGFPLPSYPDPGTSAPQRPIYVVPPQPGSVVGPNSGGVTPSQLPPRVIMPAPPPAPAGRSPGITPPAKPSVQPGTVVKEPPPLRPGTQPTRTGTPAVTGSGGSVRSKNEPDPKQGYWEVVGPIGYWTGFKGKKFFSNSGLPANKVRYSDGKPWDHGRLAIYSSSEPYYKDGYFLLFDNPDNEFWKSYADTVLAVQVKPVLPF